VISGFLGFAAAVLAAAGLYGMLGFVVSRRRGEMAIRIALGAEGSRVRRVVVGQAMVLCGCGVAVGLVAALGLGGLAGKLLFGVSPGDAGPLLAAGAAMMAVSWIAAFFPARRAAAVDPMEALRGD
jgi:ABC-type antimicrobial peptide transport system permease subunit